MDAGARVAAAGDERRMTTETATDPFWERVRELFHACAELPPAERVALLERESDAAVREETEALLAEHDHTGGFLDESLWELSRGMPREQSIGPYRLIRQLGNGGMGAVYLGEREGEQFTQRVAVKLVRADAAGTAMLRRFRQERQILAALEHPNIARLLDGGTSATGLPFLAMEYVEGTTIDAYCRDHSLSVEARLRLFLPLCDAVQYAHRNLVIHRDIKPANVLVTTDGIPKLLDFGIAKLTSDTIPADATITRLMTPDYASPEQLLGRLVTTATDVYSLGVLLFELLTGRKPFAGQERLPLAEAPRASTINRALRGDLDCILGVALDPDPNRRYASVEKFADDIRSHLGGHPIAARGATFGYRTAKFVRRNRFVVAAAVAVVVVIAVAFTVTLRQKRVAERRFDLVRTLARSIVFELHDSIATLPGSTPARELLVRRALVYLDALAADASDNAPLQMELVGAYERIGDVQGLPYRPNLGDSTGALRSYRKALAIASELHRRDRQNRQVLTLLADLHDRAGLVEQRALHFSESLADHQAARAIWEAMPDRGIAGDLALARSWVAIGDSIYLSGALTPAHADGVAPRGAYESALKILAKIAPNGPHRRDLLKEIARANQRLGGWYTRGALRSPEQSLAHHNASLAALQERAALAPQDGVARRDVADQLVMTATLYNSISDGRRALDATTEALVTLRELAAADPNNIEAEHDLAFAYEQQASALLTLDRWNEAQQSFDQALAIRRKLVEADPGNREDQRGIAGLYGMLAGMHERRGDLSEAKRWTEKTNEIIEQLKK
ncbi:MAG: eukaryotic-like serine/threonine-protein kinase [Acidobacteriota bacterium]|jgi:tetratricopeptide (TPR) repeat protein|nr:eukaryotic-like serine/threonine-protein kinase [Acidobacteriota bacterium]